MAATMLAVALVLPVGAAVAQEVGPTVTRQVVKSFDPLPRDPHDRDSWRTAAHAIHRYRIAWDITDPIHALGSNPPTDPNHRDALTHVATAIDEHHTRTIDRSLDHGFGLSR